MYIILVTLILLDFFLTTILLMFAYKISYYKLMDAFVCL